jgi:hypothetical protein
MRTTSMSLRYRKEHRKNGLPKLVSRGRRRAPPLEDIMEILGLGTIFIMIVIVAVVIRHVTALFE